MLVTHQKKQTGNGLAVTSGFSGLGNFVEEDSLFSILSTEEVGPPVDPNITAPIIYGSQSSTFGSRTVILGSTNVPGTYILPANIGYRFDPSNYKNFNLIAAGGETVDLGELRNRTNGTQSIRVYGSLTPYMLSYIRWSYYPAPDVLNNVLFVFPSLSAYSVDNIQNLPLEKRSFTDNWGGKGFAMFLPHLKAEIRRPNNSFPNLATYNFQSPGSSQGVSVATLEGVSQDLIQDSFVCISAGEFKISGYAAAPTSYTEENTAINDYNTQYGTTYLTLIPDPPTSSAVFEFMGGTVTRFFV